MAAAATGHFHQGLLPRLLGRPPGAGVREVRRQFSSVQIEQLFEKNSQSHVIQMQRPIVLKLIDDEQLQWLVFVRSADMQFAHLKDVHKKIPYRIRTLIDRIFQVDIHDLIH